MRSRITRALPLFFLPFTLACGGARGPAPATAPCPTASDTHAAATFAPEAGTRAPVNDEAARRRFFADLVAMVRRYHVFAPQTEKNLGRTWNDELPGLEDEFARATTRDALIVALIHFGNSLHNPHCGFDPSSPTEVVVLDGRFDVEWKDGAPVFYVAEAPKGSAAVAGDIVEEIDGIPASELTAKNALRSNENNWFSIARDVAASLTIHSTRTTQEGSRSTVKLRARTDGAKKTIGLAWRRASSREEGGSDYALDYSRKRCGDLPTVDYGPYALTSEGPNFCLYTSKDPRRSAYPIVRYFSFAYFRHGEASYGPGFHRALADHDALAESLASVKGARAVLLDLRDNGGGNNPNWVMDWFAPAPYTDHYVFTKLDDDLRDPAFRRDANMDDPSEARAFLAELDARAPGEAFAKKRPFFCKPDTCEWDNRYTPSHRVTTLPVALLVGPHCVSSCDSFAQQFAEWGFGPLVGEPTAAGFTTRRLRRPIVFQGDGLGELVLAFSYEVSGKTGAPIEAVPTPLTERVDRTFSNQASYDALLVEKAISRLDRGGASRTK